jgi:signal transduction histidine kinase
VDPAGLPRAVLTTKIPMRDPQGQIVGLVGLSRDITERKQAVEEIKRLNATLEQRVQERTAELTDAYAQLESFSYSVSHDLRAPLRHIIGFMDLLKKALPPGLDAQATDSLDAIGAASARMAALIEDLLTFSRIGRAEMHRDRVDLQQLLQDVLRELEPDLAGRAIAWKIGALPEVAGDAAMLRQVLVNLLDNALKFTRLRAQADIEVGCCLEPDTCIVYVRDNGVGFDPAYADKLFGVFQRLHPQAQFKGTGVGLANVRRIIQRHGGRTWAESTAGQGATFYFTLPRA